MVVAFDDDDDYEKKVSAVTVNIFELFDATQDKYTHTRNTRWP